MLRATILFGGSLLTTPIILFTRVPPLQTIAKRKLGKILGIRLEAATAIKQDMDVIRYMTITVCIAMTISLLIQ